MADERTPLTAGEFHEAMNTLMGIVATKQELKDLEERLPTREQITRLQNSTDAYTKKTEGWKHEQDVLRASHAKVKQVLIRKEIASEQELAV